MPIATTIPLRLVYRGGPPVHWTDDAARFGVQDRAERLLAPIAHADGAQVFDFSVECRIGADGVADFAGAFVHGPRGGRFVYLSWRNSNGAYAQRFKLPLATITAERIAQAHAAARPIEATLVIEQQRATTAGSNVGGTRPVNWA